jgi:hypothetical protein
MMMRICSFMLVLLLKIGCSICLVQCDAMFEEENGLVVIEAESIPQWFNGPRGLISLALAIQENLF